MMSELRQRWTDAVSIDTVLDWWPNCRSTGLMMSELVRYWVNDVRTATALDEAVKPIEYFIEHVSIEIFTKSLCLSIEKWRLSNSAAVLTDENLVTNCSRSDLSIRNLERIAVCSKIFFRRVRRFCVKYLKKKFLCRNRLGNCQRCKALR